MVAPCNGKLGDAIIGKRIVIVTDMDMSGIRFLYRTTHIRQDLIRAKTNVNTKTETGTSQSERWKPVDVYCEEIKRLLDVIFLDRR